MGVGHGEEEEAGDHPREGVDQGGQQGRRRGEVQLPRQPPSAAPADDDAQPGQQDEPDLDRQHGEEEMQGEERRARAVAPVGAAGELVRIPERRPPGAHLAAQEEQPGLDLMGHVPQVRIARRRIGEPLPGCELGQRRGRAGHAVRQPERRRQQGHARQTADGPGNTEFAPPEEQAGQREQREKREGGIHDVPG